MISRLGPISRKHLEEREGRHPETALTTGIFESVDFVQLLGVEK
jgi:hypothetical protein